VSTKSSDLKSFLAVTPPAKIPSTVILLDCYILKAIALAPTKSLFITVIYLDYIAEKAQPRLL